MRASVQGFQVDVKNINPSTSRKLPFSIAIDLPQDEIIAFCHRWQICEFYLFGSVLRADFRTDSDVDVMVSFAPDAHWGLLALVQMKEELETVFGRDVDLLTKKSIEQSENWIRRKEILSTAQMVYGSR